jgi:4-amino-4-deoxy-L-arabinose transferase-like glycosyltransferase
MRGRPNFPFDLLALLLSLAAILAAAAVTGDVFEGLPHFEDEFAYSWQAQVFADGRLYLPTPDFPDSFLVPFVVDYQGIRFSKYPPGWSLLLALGVRLGLRAWVNPLLAGLGVWLIYLLGKRIFNAATGLLAAALTVSSPFFLINSGTLLNHPLGLVLSAGLALAWLKAFGVSNQSPRWKPALLAGLLTGALALTRPWTAIGVAIPLSIHALYILWRSDRQKRLSLGIFCLGAVASSSLLFLWQYLLTGNPILNTYTLWWQYDKVGFGAGFGPTPDGHNLEHAFANARRALRIGSNDLFGWGGFSWIFLPFGLWAARRNCKAWLIAGFFPALVFVYLAYFTTPYIIGPRYYYEGLYSLTLISAAGIAFLAGKSLEPVASLMKAGGWRKARALGMTALVAGLVGMNLIFYTPFRLASLHNLYGIGTQNQAPFLTASAQALTPALIIVHADRWMNYGALLDLEDPELDSPFIFAWNMDAETDQKVAKRYPNRAVYHYYPEQPYTFYTNPLPEEGAGQ